MPQYQKLRDFVSHRITFDYDTGARIVGYVTSARPAAGPVQVLNMTRVDILDSTGRVVEHHASYTLIPNALVGFRVTEGPGERE